MTAQDSGLQGSQSTARRSHSARVKTRPKRRSRLLSNSQAQRSMHVFVCSRIICAVKHVPGSGLWLFGEQAGRIWRDADDRYDPFADLDRECRSAQLDPQHTRDFPPSGR